MMKLNRGQKNIWNENIQIETKIIATIYNEGILYQFEAQIFQLNVILNKSF